MRLDKISLEGTIRVLHTNPSTSEEISDKILDLFAGTATSMVTKQFYDLFLMKFPNGLVLNSNVQEDLAITNILLGTGDGTATEFNLSYPIAPVKPNSVSLTYTIGGTQYTANDDGSGNITGDQIDSATIDYDNNNTNITFTAALDTDSPILMNFTRGIASDDTLVAGFYFDLTSDSNPALDDNDFTNKLGLDCPITQVDWYQTESQYIYRILNTVTYTDEASDKLTGLGLYYRAITGDTSGTSYQDMLIAKSTILNVATLFEEEGGLILNNKADITVDIKFTVQK